MKTQKMKTQIAIIVCILFSISTSLAQNFTVNGFTYKVTSESPNEAEVLGGTSIPTDLVLPAIIPFEGEDFTLVSVGNNAFKGEGLTSVTLPTTIRSIGDFAFDQNSLTTIELPEGLETIGQRGFRFNSLPAITLPSTVIAIGQSAFGANPLDSVTALGTTPATIQSTTFGGDVSNKDLFIPEGTTQAYLDADWTGFASIDDGVIDIGDTFTSGDFRFKVIRVSPNEVAVIDLVSAITDIEIPSVAVDNSDNSFSVTTIGSTAFLDDSLTSVIIPNSVTIIDGAAFRRNNLTSVNIPNSVTKINFGAFLENSLTSVTIPSSVTSIFISAFDLNDITEVIARGTIPADVKTFEINDSFGDRSNINLFIPEGTTQAYLDADWTGFASINEGIFPIGFAFEDSGLLYRVTSQVPAEVEVIGGIAVPSNLVLPASVSFENLAFSLTSIGELAFFQDGLTSVTIPNSVTSIGESAFFVNELTSVTIPNSVTSIGSKAFRKNALTNVIIPNSVTFIGRAAFEFNQLTSVTIPNSLTSIAIEAFRENALTSVIIPDSVTIIEAAAFADNALTNVIIPDGVTELQLGAFSDNKLTSVTIPNSVTTISIQAFAFNELTSIVIPSSVTQIRSLAFRGNPLTEVIAEGTIPATINTGTNDSFDDRNAINLFIPEGTTQAYLDADWTGFASITGVVPEFEVNGFSYRVTSFTSLEVEVIGGITVPTDLALPEVVSFEGEDFTLVSVGNNAFKSENLASVTLPTTIRSIGNFAFDQNELTTIELPEGLETIGQRGFRFNSLTDITIPSTIVSIGQSAFGANPLATVTALGTTPATIQSTTFGGDRSGIDLFVPVGTIDDYETTGWTGFASITEFFPVGLEFVSNGLSYRITSVTPNEVAVTGGTSIPADLVLPEVVPFEGEDFTLVSVGNNAFQEVDLTSVALPTTIRSIGDFAFDQNSLTIIELPEDLEIIGQRGFRFNSLTAITLPSTVVSIGQSAFGANPLATVTALGTTPAAIGTTTFTGDRSGINLFIPVGTTQAYLDADWTGFASIDDGDIAVGDTFASGDFLFEVTSVSPNEVAVIDLVSAITDTVIPNAVFEPSGVDSFNLTAIGDNAFNNKQLTSVTIPNSVTSIADAAFRDNALTSVTIPNSVTSIGELAFFNNALTSVIIPDSVTIIEREVFLDNALTSVIIPDSVTIIEPGAFRDNALTSVIIPNSVASIGAFTFADNPLTEVITEGTIPATIVTGNVDSFGDRSVIDLTVPSGLIQDYLDADWTGFASVDDGSIAVGDTFESGDFLFEVTSLSPNTVSVVGLVTPITTLEIPNGVSDTENEFSVTAIGERAFSESGITSVIIPNTILTIGDAAFLDNGLSSVAIPDSVTAIGVASFAKNFFESITIPVSMTSMGNEAFGKNPLTQVISLAIAPATIEGDTFGDRSLIDLTIPEGTLASYIAAEWIGFASVIENGFTIGDTFESGDFLFEVTSIGPNEVAVIDLISAITRVEIPIIVLGTSSTTTDDNSVEFSVTAIGDAAFIGRDIGQVFIPDSVTFIGVEAFAANVIERVRLGAGIVTIEKAAFDKNNLTNIFIPSSVTFIGDIAFNNNPLTAIISESIDPATISEDTFGDRSVIDLTIPLGTFETYVEANWTGFKTFTETEIDPGNRSSHPDVDQGGEIEEPLVGSTTSTELAIENAFKAPEVSLFMNDDSLLSIRTTDVSLKGYTIYNIFGVEVAHGRESNVSLAHVSSGIYIVHVHFIDAEMVVKKVIK